MLWSTISFHAGLGGTVLAVGAFVMWEGAPLVGTLTFAMAAVAFLWWQGRSVAAIWAWTALGLGIESMAWPIATMVQIRLAGNEPSDEQMETILNAVLFGLFTSVFWVTFAFGLFKRIREADSPPAPISARASAPIREKTKRSRS